MKEKIMNMSKMKNRRKPESILSATSTDKRLRTISVSESIGQYREHKYAIFKLYFNKEEIYETVKRR